MEQRARGEGGGREGGGTDGSGAERQRGTVKWFDEVRGFGFIGRDGEVDVFVHASALEDGGEDGGEGEGAGPPLRPGEAVTFRVVEGARGLQAREVRRRGAPPR